MARAADADDGAGPGRSPSKGERTRRLVVASAVREFANRGHARGSLAAIAREVGITAAAIHPYYATKDLLFLAAAEADVAALIDEAEAVADGSATPWLTYLSALMERIDAHPLAVRILTEGPRSLSDELLALPPLRRIGARLQAGLEEGQRTGMIRGDIDAGLIATALETIALAMFTARFTNGLGTQPDRQLAMAMLLVAATAPTTG